jgi:hypothetical protein
MGPEILPLALIQPTGQYLIFFYALYHLPELLFPCKAKAGIMNSSACKTAELFGS